MNVPLAPLYCTTVDHTMEFAMVAFASLMTIDHGFHGGFVKFNSFNEAAYTYTPSSISPLLVETTCLSLKNRSSIIFFATFLPFLQFNIFSIYDRTKYLQHFVVS